MGLFGPPDVQRLARERDYAGLAKALKHKGAEVRRDAASAVAGLLSFPKIDWGTDPAQWPKTMVRGPVSIWRKIAKEPALEPGEVLLGMDAVVWVATESPASEETHDTGAMRWTTTTRSLNEAEVDFLSSWKTNLSLKQWLAYAYARPSNADLRARIGEKEIKDTQRPLRLVVTSERLILREDSGGFAPGPALRGYAYADVRSIEAPEGTLILHFPVGPLAFAAFTAYGVHQKILLGPELEKFRAWYHADPERRRAYAMYAQLWIDGGEPMLEALADAAFDAGPAVRTAARAALERVGGPQAQEALADMADAAAAPGAR